MMNPHPDYMYEQDFDNDLQLEWLAKVLPDLSEREALILSLRYGLGGQKILTLTKTGQHLGISAERVRQLEIRALQKLRAWARVNE